MTYGVTPTGFNKKTLDILKSEIGEDLRDLISPKLNLLDTSVWGQLIGIFGDKLRELWDVDQAVYNSSYPDSASDASLDEVASITGATRLAATKGTVTLDRLYLDSGVTIPVGSIVGVGATGARWITTAAVTNSASVATTVSTTAEAQNTGEINGYAGEIDTIDTPVVGWSAAAALTNTVDATFILDGMSLTLKVDRGTTQTVNFAGGDPWSAADVATQIETDTTGVDAYAVTNKIRVASESEGEGSSIEITGGTANAVLLFGTDEIKGFNSEDADIGTEVEEDPAFRARRELLLRAAGAASVEAIRAALLELLGTIQALVVENATGIVDANGLPPNSFESIVQQASWTTAEEQEVGDTIWETKAAGIKAYGSESTTVTDSMGFTHQMGWSKPTDVPIYMELSLTTDSELYPSNGDDLVKAAIVAYGETQTAGEDVIALQFKSVPLDVAGVEDVPTFKIDVVSPPVGTSNITMGVRQQPTFDTSRITIV